MRRHLCTCLWLLGTAALVPAADSGRLAAQRRVPQSRSALTGVVVDPSHAAMSGLTIVVEDLVRRVTHRTTTDREGRFQFRELPAGDYEIEVAAPGFEVFREQTLVAGPLVEQEIVLAVGVQEETLTVVAGLSPPDGDAGSVRERGEPETCEPRLDQETRSPVGGQVRRPRMLSRATPAFPEHLRESGMDGTVRLAGHISAQGTMADLTIVEASHPDYAAAAEDALRTWTWEETLLNCTPVELDVAVTIRFLAQQP